MAARRRARQWVRSQEPRGSPMAVDQYRRRRRSRHAAVRRRRSTCTPTRCRCRCCSGWPTPAWPTSPGCRRGGPAGPAGERRGAGRPAAPGPLAARRGRPALGDGRARRQPSRGVAAAVPVLLHGRGRGLRHDHRRPQGNDELADLRRGRPGPAARARARCRSAGPGAPRRLAAAWTTWAWRDRHRQPRRRPRPRRPGQRGAVGAAGRAAYVRVPAPQRGAGRAPAARLLAAAAGRLPDGDRAGGGPAGVRAGAGAVRPDALPGARRRLPAVAARPDGHGLGAQGRGPHHARSSRASSPAGSTTTRRCSPARCCAGWSRTWVPSTCCWAPTTRSSWATSRPWRRCAASAWTPRPPGRSCGTAPRACSGVPVTR